MLGHFAVLSLDVHFHTHALHFTFFLSSLHSKHLQLSQQLNTFSCHGSCANSVVFLVRQIGDLNLELLERGEGREARRGRILVGIPRFVFHFVLTVHLGWVVGDVRIILVEGVVMTQRRLDRCGDVSVRRATGRPAGWRQVAARPTQLNRFYRQLDFQIAGKGVPRVAIRNNPE